MIFCLCFLGGLGIYPLLFRMISVQVESVFFRFFGMMAELRPSGFPEYSPAEQLVFDQIVGIIQAQYQQF